MLAHSGPLPGRPLPGESERTDHDLVDGGSEREDVCLGQVWVFSGVVHELQQLVRHVPRVALHDVFVGHADAQSRQPQVGQFVFAGVRQQDVLWSHESEPGLMSMWTIFFSCRIVSEVRMSRRMELITDSRTEMFPIFIRSAMLPWQHSIW